MRRSLVTVFAIVAVIGIAKVAHCADVAEQKKAPAVAMTPVKKPMQPVKSSVAFLSGTITKVDTTVPNSAKIEITTTNDGKSHVVELAPGVNVVKVIDVSELKSGEKARIMVRKMGDKDVAISVITGKMPEMPRMKPALPAQSAPAAATPKQQETKK
jgi:hypothetical protein